MLTYSSHTGMNGDSLAHPNTAVAIPKEIPMVVPKHGRGKLRVGGSTKGGRPPSKIRAACAYDFDTRRAILQEIADNPKEAPRDRIRAIDVLGKYSGVAATELKLNTEGVEPLRVIVEHVMVEKRQSRPAIVVEPLPELPPPKANGTSAGG